MTKNKQNKLNPIPYFIISLFTAIFFDIMLTNNILTNYIYKDFKYFEITLIENTGGAFSFMANYPITLIIASILALCFILYELFRDTSKYTTMVYFFSSLLTAGIICNMYERITLGFVRDFISIKQISFPIFNISDILITSAVLVIIFLVITKRYRNNVE